MKMDMVIVKKNEIFTTSLVISEGVLLEHRAVMSLLKKYSKTEILSTFEMSEVSTKGRSLTIALLSEEQATFLIMLMKNSSKVIDFKQKLTKAFFKQRKLLSQLASQKQNAEWIEKRNESKTMRKESTDIIQKFIEYAKEQGSKSAEKYYMNFSRMELTGLFMIEQKYPNAREIMSIRQLNLISMADEAISIVLEEEMSKKTPYKEIYQKAKEKIELLAKIFPPSPLPALLQKQEVLL